MPDDHLSNTRPHPVKANGMTQVYLTLSMPHATIVAISHLVKKVPSLELLHATKFSVMLV